MSRQEMIAINRAAREIVGAKQAARRRAAQAERTAERMNLLRIEQAIEERARTQTVTITQGPAVDSGEDRYWIEAVGTRVLRAAVERVPGYLGKYSNGRTGEYVFSVPAAERAALWAALEKALPVGVAVNGPRGTRVIGAAKAVAA